MELHEHVILIEAKFCAKFETLISSSSKDIERSSGFQSVDKTTPCALGFKIWDPGWVEHAPGT